MTDNKQTVAFKSLGCKLNQYEIQALREGFLKHGFNEVPSNQSADYYILNTCTVTAGADSGARVVIRSFRKQNTQAKIIVTGCYAESNPDDIKNLLGVEMVVSNKHKNQIVSLVTGNEAIKQEESPFFEDGISYFEEKSKAFVKVQDGCNYFCTFCKIPFVRGRLISRDEGKILDEVRRLVDYGYEEIILSGVCLGSYGRDLFGHNKLADLLKKVLALSGNFRIRLSSIDPRDTPIELAELMRDNPKLCRHLHLSLQSGSDKILKLMKRGYDSSEYLDLVKKIRQIIPDIGFTTDVIVGFPGEDEQSFLETKAFLKLIKFNHIHFFPYSQRDETKAKKLPEQLPKALIKTRMALLVREQEERLSHQLTAHLGKDASVLVEMGRTEDGSYQGFTDNYIKYVLPQNTSFEAGKIAQCQGKYIENNKILC